MAIFSQTRLAAKQPEICNKLLDISPGKIYGEQRSFAVLSYSDLRLLGSMSFIFSLHTCSHPDASGNDS